MLAVAGGMGPVATSLVSLDPADGRRLWWCRGAGETASPAYGAGVVYFDSGRGGPGTAVDPTGHGNVSASHVKWTIGQVPEGLSSPTIVDGRVYRLHSPGVLKCWDARDGRQVYAKRLEGIFSTWASPIVDPHGRLYFVTAGKSYVVAAGRSSRSWPSTIWATATIPRPPPPAEASIWWGEERLVRPGNAESCE